MVLILSCCYNRCSVGHCTIYRHTLALYAVFDSLANSFVLFEMCVAGVSSTPEFISDEHSKYFPIFYFIHEYQLNNTGSLITNASEPHTKKKTIFLNSWIYIRLWTTTKKNEKTTYKLLASLSYTYWSYVWLGADMLWCNPFGCNTQFLTYV